MMSEEFDIEQLPEQLKHYEYQLKKLNNRISELEEFIRIIVLLSPANLVEAARQRSGSSKLSQYADDAPKDPISMEAYKRFFETFGPDRLH